MPEVGYPSVPGKPARRGVKEEVRMSDARMSGTMFGTVVLHVSPEAAGGPLRLVRDGDGDRTRLSVRERRLDLLAPAEELARRTAPEPARPGRGCARLFHDHVLQAEEGCDFNFLRAGG